MQSFLLHCCTNQKGTKQKLHATSCYHWTIYYVSCEFDTNLVASLEHLGMYWVLAMIQAVFYGSYLNTRQICGAFLFFICHFFKVLDDKFCTHTWRIHMGSWTFFHQDGSFFSWCFCSLVKVSTRMVCFSSEDWGEPRHKLPYDFEALPCTLFSCFCSVGFSVVYARTRPKGKHFPSDPVS